MRLAPIIALFLPTCFYAQSYLDVLFEFQAYPTGLIPGVRIEKSLGVKSAAHVRLGYNWIRHRDLGKHDDEHGVGFGFTIGYKRYFRNNHDGFSLGLKNDIWWNTIDWTDEPSSSGTTDITVLQPTLELAYSFIKGDLVISPSLAFGFEWNVRTEGEPTGEGAILLVGIQIGKRF